MSPRAVYAAGKAIRGGAPICFPWFGAHPERKELPAHGFARTRSFELRSSVVQGDQVVAELALESDAETFQLFPHHFVATLRVTVGRELSLAFEVANTGDTTFDYELALHTYLGVSDVRKVVVDGLGGATYNDKVLGERGVVQPPGALRVVGETDRVYASDERITVLDEAQKRRLVVDKTNSKTTVLWNPWSEKVRTMSDMGEATYETMLCVEAANVSPNAIRLAPRERHTTTTIISAETP
jgi:glucose-6-phosphate 1-epimerase